MAIIIPRFGPPQAALDFAFRGQVIAALSELCPCHTIFVDAGGTIQAVPFKGTHDQFCRCYCSHRASCNLIADLVSSVNVYSILPAGGGNSYTQGNRTVNWNPNRRQGGRNTRGDTNRPTSIGLGHELIHAVHHDKGRLGPTRRQEEHNTVRGENQLRDEMGEPDRTHYGPGGVPNRNQQDIDERERYSCCCNLLCRIWRAVKLFFY
jgi:hypothetical protein